MICRTIFLICALATAAQAETVPALYDVTGVAANDVLNIRAEPGATAPQLGEVSPDATGIEVVTLSADGKWAQINQGESSGWVSARFLARQPGPDWTAMETPLSCFGTEPFWSLAYNAKDRNMTFEEMGQDPIPLWFDWQKTSANHPGVVGWQIAGPKRQGFATLRQAACSDGMSDRQMGIAIDFFITGIDGSSAPMLGLSGCCSIQP